MSSSAARAVLAGAIDYAGLFPPAGLAMERAVANFRRYREGSQSWALGRFVCPVGRLGEFAALRGDGGGVWDIAAVASGESWEEAHAIARFNQDYYGRAAVTAIEAKTPDAAAVHTRVRASAGLRCFCEIDPQAPDFAATAAAVKAAGAAAKLRTGGVQPSAIPPLAAVAQFLAVCHQFGLSFKATAGLHHPYLGNYPLAYEEDAPIALMHGFVNLTLAAACCASGGEGAEVSRLLAAQDEQALPLHPWSAEQIAAGRRFFVSFGSCSFEEPLQWPLLR